MKIPSKIPDKYSYKITNWKEYNNSLRKRGEVSLWLSAKLLPIWKELDVIKISIGEQIYSNIIIEFCLITWNNV